MREFEQQSGLYDPEHPWLVGQHEDPSKANWFAEFVNPVGRTAKPVFLRGQTFLALFRTIVIAVGLGALSASPWIGAGVLFFGLLSIVMMSAISHVRRLTDSGRSPIWAVIIFIPLLVASGMTVPSLSNIPAKVEKAAEDARKAREKVLAARTTPKTEDSAATTAEPKEEKTEAKPQQQRRGPPPKPVTTESLLAQSVSLAANICILLSFFTALFSLLFVARGQTKPENTDPFFVD